MIVGQGIEHGFAFAPVLHQFSAFQNAQLVGHGALGQIQHPGNIAHAQLGFKQRIEDFHPGGIGEHFEQLRQIVQYLVGGQVFLYCRHAVFVILLLLAARGGFLFLFLLHGVSPFNI